jgi:hypothetical protein
MYSLKYTAVRLDKATNFAERISAKMIVCHELEANERLDEMAKNGWTILTTESN